MFFKVALCIFVYTFIKIEDNAGVRFCTLKIEENVMKTIKECGFRACPTIITECGIGACPAIIPHAFAVVVGKSISQDALLINGVTLGEHEIAVAIPQSLLDKYVAEVTGE